RRARSRRSPRVPPPLTTSSRGDPIPRLGHRRWGIQPLGALSLTAFETVSTSTAHGEDIREVPATATRQGPAEGICPAV
ncbi:MAG: hypothetical protein WKF73_12010, partial [Nocardioidaceae bacterium]